MPGTGRRITAEQRLKIVGLIGGGLKPMEISRTMGIRYQTVALWRDRWMSGAGLSPKRKPVPPNNPHRATLHRMFYEGASYGEMAQAIGRSKPRVGQILKLMNLCWADSPKRLEVTPAQRAVERQAESLRRAATRAERRGFPVGVLLMKNGRYRAKLGTRHLGYFPTVEAAVRARAEAARVVGERVEKSA